MRRYAFDANVVSELRRPRPEPGVRRRVEDAADEACLPAPAWHELVYGTQRLPMGRRRIDLEKFLDAFRSRCPVLPYTEQAAEWHGAERARLEAAGTPRPHSDGQIAAIAATEGLVLVTRNVRDFAGYRDLTVESWWPDQS